MAKRTVRLTESEFKKVISESVKTILTEKLNGSGSKKILQLAAEHGGIDGSWYKNGGGVGSGWKRYLSEIPEDLVLGVGDVDLHVWPHKEFEINGISSNDMEEIALSDGKFIYYNKKAFQEILKSDGREESRSKNTEITDGAFKYTGKYSNAIEKKKNQRDTYKNFHHIITSIENTISQLQSLKHFSSAYNIKDNIENAIELLLKVKDTLKTANDNLVFNTPDVTGGFYSPSNKTKSMKARDSREPNSQGRTDTYFDVQGGGLWGHDKRHPERFSSTYKYR